MKQKGFTLIELLAVIAVLAIIALIATPIVMNIIDTTRKEAAERSVSNLEHAADIYYYQNGGNITFYCNDGVCSNGEKKLEIDGKGPEDGIIKISKEGDIALNSIIINKHICYKDGESYKCEKANKTSENTTNGVLTLNESKSTILSNYIIKGNSYQETRSGKNLFDVDSYTTDDSGYIRISTKDLVEGRTYTISSSKPFYWFKISDTRNGYNSVQLNDGTQYYKYTFTMTRNSNISATVTQYIFMAISDQTYFSQDINEFKNAKIQIEEGNVATEYEPYGKMPSSEYPSEIQSVGDLVTEEGPNKGKYEIPVKVTGKNLFNIDNLTNDKLLSGFNYIITYSYQLKPNTSYYVKVNYPILNVSKGYTLISINKNVNQSLNNTILISGNNTSFKNTEGIIKTGDDGMLYIGNNQSKANIDYVLKNVDLQIEEGLVGTEYEPYKEETTSIYLDEPLRRVGDYADYIDFKAGKVVRNIKETIFDGTENWKKSTYGTNCYFLVDNNLLAKENIKTIDSNCFKGVSYNDRTISENNIAYIDIVYKSMTFRNTEYTDVNSFINFLKNNRVKADSVLTTPIEETIDLQDIKVNKGGSIITVDTSVKPSEVIVDYYK